MGGASRALQDSIQSPRLHMAPQAGTWRRVQGRHRAGAGQGWRRSGQCPSPSHPTDPQLPTTCPPAPRAGTGKIQGGHGRSAAPHSPPHSAHSIWGWGGAQRAPGQCPIPKARHGIQDKHRQAGSRWADRAVPHPQATPQTPTSCPMAPKVGKERRIQGRYRGDPGWAWSC